MQKKVENYLSDSIGNNIILKKEDNKIIPLYLIQRYNVYMGNLCGIKCTFLFQKDSLVVVNQMVSHIEKFYSLGYDNLVFVIQNMSNEQRVRLIENKIAFIDPYRQLYIPYIFLRIDDTIRRKKVKNITKFGPATQLTFIALMLQESEDVSPNDLGKTTKLSRISINRSIRELVSLGLIEEYGKNTRKKYRRIELKRFWRKGRQYLISPIKNTYWVTTIPEDLIVCYSGKSALAKLTMLDDGLLNTYAIYKEKKKIIENYIVEKDNLINSYNDIFQLEIWSYDPLIFADKDRNIDIISLYSILKDNDEPRIEIELNNLMEEYKL